MYKPQPVNVDKYNRFLNKLNLLVESKEYLANVPVTTRDKEILDTIFIKNPDSNRLIIFFHGNYGNITMRFDMIKFLYNYASVLIFDYRSYGLSTGSVSGLSANKLLLDSEAVWNYAVNSLNFPDNRISLFGESLGCAIALQIAARLQKQNIPQSPRAIILNCPFGSLHSMMVRMFEKFNLGIMGKIIAYFFAKEFNNIQCISQLDPKTQIIIAHSPRDEVIPYNEGYGLYSTAIKTHPQTQFLPINGIHSNLILTDNYIYAIADIHHD